MAGQEQTEQHPSKQGIAAELKQAWQEAQIGWLTLPGDTVQRAADILSQALGKFTGTSGADTHDGEKTGGVQ